MHGIVALIMAMFLVNQAAAGDWTPNNFIYKPALGARGQTEKSTFDSGLERVDAHLAKYKTLGDPGYANLGEALTTMGSTETALVIPAGAVSISANTTIPANVQLKVAKRGQFTIAKGVTLTINGHLEAGGYQIFFLTGTGKVRALGRAPLPERSVLSGLESVRRRATDRNPARELPVQGSRSA